MDMNTHEYTITEFRSSLRNAFKQVIAGDRVIIYRDDEPFELRRGATPGKSIMPETLTNHILRVKATELSDGDKILANGSYDFVATNEAQADQTDEKQVVDIIKTPAQARTKLGTMGRYERCQHGNVKGLCKKGCK